MNFADVAAVVDGIPYTDVSKGRTFYDFILSAKPRDCLELGFAHGVSSCYFAAALDELGPGHRLTCVDLDVSNTMSPTIEELLARCKLSHVVDVVRMKSSYTWFLKRQIELATSSQAPQPRYDFCFIDGGKNWTIDGAAFFMADKLLRQGGWIALDDYAWTYRDHERLTGSRETSGIDHAKLEDDELDRPQVEAIFRLLVMQHPGYSNFKVQDDVLAWAQKTTAGSPRLSFESSMNLKYKAVGIAKKAMHHVRLLAARRRSQP